MIDWIKDHSLGIGWSIIMLVLTGLVVAAIFASLPQLDEGIVVDKDYEPPRTRLRYTTINGRTTPHVYHDGADWRIKVQGVNEDGEHRTEWWDVGAGLYELIEIGDYVYKEGGTVCIKKEETP